MYFIHVLQVHSHHDYITFILSRDVICAKDLIRSLELYQSRNEVKVVYFFFYWKSLIDRAFKDFIVYKIGVSLEAIHVYF